MKKTAIILIIILITFCTFLCSSAAEKKEIKVAANMTEIPYGKNASKTIILKGDVKITHNNTTVFSQYTEYNKEKNTAVSPGKILIKSPEADITADKGTGDFKNKICTVQNNVNAAIKRQSLKSIKTAENEITENINVTADYGEYDYKNKLLTAKGNVTIKEKDRVILSDMVVYNFGDQLFTLSGNVKGTDSDGQTFASPGPVYVCITEGNEYVKAPNAGISFFVEDK